ncbi:hypothetical protein EON65_27715 [archaeon]|nr:MAG: hypothetical protein EON65_27715 [archaeon]
MAALCAAPYLHSSHSTQKSLAIPSSSDAPYHSPAVHVLLSMILVTSDEHVSMPDHPVFAVLEIESRRRSSLASPCVDCH